MLILLAITIYFGFLFYNFIFSSSVTGVFSIANLLENISLIKDILKGNFYPFWLNFFSILGFLEIKKIEMEYYVFYFL